MTRREKPGQKTQTAKLSLGLLRDVFKKGIIKLHVSSTETGILFVESKMRQTTPV